MRGRGRLLLALRLLLRLVQRPVQLVSRFVGLLADLVDVLLRGKSAALAVAELLDELRGLVGKVHQFGHLLFEGREVHGCPFLLLAERLEFFVLVLQLLPQFCLRRFQRGNLARDVGTVAHIFTLRWRR